MKAVCWMSRELDASRVGERPAFLQLGARLEKEM